jgi:membrane protease YdiL (CAAX protease family)
MSILVAATSFLAAAPLNPAPTPGFPPASQPNINPEIAGGLMVALKIWTAVAVALAIRFGVFRRDSVVGPKRLPEQGGTGILAGILILGFVIWLLSQWVYIGYKQIQWRQQGIEVDPKAIMDALSPRDFAILSTVPPMVAFLVMVASGMTVGRGWLDRLGFSLRKIPSGIASGIIGFLIIGPAILWTLIVLDKVYRLVHFEHPTEHVLLKSLGQAEDKLAAIFIALGASICAPLFEEFLFRGHVQTLIRQILMLLSAKRVPMPLGEGPPLPLIADLKVIPGSGGIVPDGPMPLAYHRMEPAVISLRPAAWHGWLAIFGTSLIFAMFHPAWMWPPIFVLSLGLGYVYERTGNLWAAITIHCLFNSMETVQYLLLIRGH